MAARRSGEGGRPPIITDMVPDMVRKMLALGLSGFFTTEEALRRALGDTIPQDWVDFAASQSERTRQDFARAVAEEVGRVVANVDFAEILGHLFEDRGIEVHARVRLLPRDDDGARRAETEHVEVGLEGERSPRRGADADPDPDDGSAREPDCE